MFAQNTEVTSSTVLSAVIGFVILVVIFLLILAIVFCVIRITDYYEENQNKENADSEEMS